MERRWKGRRGGHFSVEQEGESWNNPIRDAPGYQSWKTKTDRARNWRTFQEEHKNPTNYYSPTQQRYNNTSTQSQYNAHPNTYTVSAAPYCNASFVGTQTNPYYQQYQQQASYPPYQAPVTTYPPGLSQAYPSYSHHNLTTYSQPPLSSNAPDFTSGANETFSDSSDNEDNSQEEKSRYTQVGYHQLAENEIEEIDFQDSSDDEDRSRSNESVRYQGHQLQKPRALETDYLFAAKQEVAWKTSPWTKEHEREVFGRIDTLEQEIERLSEKCHALQLDVDVSKAKRQSLKEHCEILRNSLEQAENKAKGTAKETWSCPKVLSGLSLESLGSLKRDMLEALVSIDEEEKSRRDTMMCVICWEEKKSVACLPCGHVMYCSSCSASPDDDEKEVPASLTTCPICRAAVTSLCKLYF